MERTIIVQLNPTPEQARSLKTTLEHSTACFNAVAAEGFTTTCSNGVELHKRTYYPLRAAYPDLPAQLVCSARVKATEAVKSALTWKVKKEQAYPQRVEKARKQGKPVPPFKPATIAVLNRSFTVAPVAINSMQTSILPPTFGTSIWPVLPASVHLRWWVALSLSLSFRPFGVRNKPLPSRHGSSDLRRFLA